MNADGTGQTRLTSDVASDESPSWSTDGSKIAFSSTRDGDAEIFVMDANGTSQTQLTSNMGKVDALPKWSPDGSRITFTSDRTGNNYNIYTMDADGSNSTRLTTDAASDESPSWSPDGSKIVFQTDRDGNYEIYTMNSDGTSHIRLTNNAASDKSPSWSPDGSKIVFQTDRDGNYEIYTMNADGTSQTLLTNNAAVDTAPSWNIPYRIGSAEINASVSRTVTVENKGSLALVVTSTTSMDGQFTASPSSFTVAAGGSQNMTMTFTPTSTGVNYSTLTILSNDLNAAMVKLTVNGTGTVTTPPGVPGGLSATAGNNQVSLSWTANTESDLSHYVIYRSASNGFTPAATDSIGRVNKPGTTFTNTGLSAGTTYFKIAAVDSVGNKSSASAQASATLAPGYSQSSASLSSDTVNVGSSGTATFTISNTGTAALTVSGIPISGTDAAQFSVSPTSFTIDAGAVTQTVTVTFTPSGSSGSRSAGLSITHNASGSPATVSLSGTAQVLALAALSLSSTSLSFGNVEKGQSAQQTFRVRNTGTATLTVSAMSDDSDQYSFSPGAPLNINAGDSTTVTVTFTPLSVGSKSASLSVAHNAPGSPSSISLSGAGVDTTPPATLSGLSATAGNNRVTLTWTASTESDLFHYVIYRSTSNGFTPAATDSIGRVNKPGTTFTNTGLSAGTYYFKIAAVDTAGNKSAESSQVSATIASVLSPSITSLTLDSTRVGSASQKTFTVSNIGTAALAVSSISASGTDAAQFSVDPTSFTVNAGATAQTVTVTFTPTSSGAKTAALTISGNDPANPTKTVSLTGAGTQPVLSLSSTNLTFGDVQVGQSKQVTFTVSNTGTASLTVSSVTRTGADSSQFTFSPPPVSFTINPGGQVQTITVTFAPSSVGPKTVSLSVAHNAAGSPSSVTLTGNGTAQPPSVAINPTTLSFGDVRVGQSDAQTLTITNSGQSSLTVSAITSNGAAFVASPTSATVAAGQSQTVTVTFTPSARGDKSETLTITHNAAGSPATVSVSGKGTAPVLTLSETSLAFGDVGVNASGAQTLTVSNTGDADLSVTAITSGDATFTVSQTSFTVNPNNSQAVTLTFRPTAAGSKTGTLTITHNATGSPHTVTLSGTAQDVSPPAALSGLSATAGNNRVTLTWTASAESDLSHNVIYRSTTASALGDSIAKVDKPGTTFTNTGLDAGTYYYRIKAVDASGNQSAESNQVSEALAPVCSHPSDSLSFGSVSIGASGTANLTVSNTGTATLSVTGITVFGAGASQFSVSPASFTINAGGPVQTVTVTFTPAGSPGSRSSGLSIAHNEADSPHTIILSGTAQDVTPRALPSGLSATAGANQAALSWTASTASDFSHYVIYRSTSSGFTPAATDSIGRVNKPGTTFTNTGLNAGTYYFKIKAVDASGNKSAESSQVSATLAPVLSPSITSLTLDSTRVGSTSQKTFTISNTGTAALTVSGILISGTDAARFSVSPTAFTVNPGAAAQTVIVTFTPTSSGTKSAALTISSNDPAGSTRTVSLTGAGTQPVLSLSSTNLTFGDVQVGQSKQVTFTVSNPGTASLTVSSITSGDATFTVSQTSFTVNPNNSQAVTITFRPLSVGLMSAALSVSHNASGSPSSVSLTGNGILPPAPPSPPPVSPPVPRIQVSPEGLSFGEVEVGKNKALVLSISNVGDGDRSVNLTSSDNIRFGVSDSSFTLSPGSRKTLTITFAPSAPDILKGTLKVVSNDPDQPILYISIVGVGKAPRISAPPPSIDFQRAPLDSAVSQAVVLKNTGTSDLSVDSLITIGKGPFQVVSRPFSLKPDSSARIEVTVTPSDMDSLSGTLTIFSNAFNSTRLTVPMRGIGVSGRIVISPERLDLGAVVIGDTSSSVLTIRNEGNGLLFIHKVTVNHPAFSLSDVPFILVPGTGRSLRVMFRASTSGTASAEVSVHSDDRRRSVVMVPVSAIGRPAPDVSLSDGSHAYGFVTPGVSVPWTLTVRNTGTEGLTITGVRADSPFIFQGEFPKMVAVSDSILLVVSFSPLEGGEFRGRLAILTDDPDEPEVYVNLSGSAVKVALSLDLDLTPGNQNALSGQASLSAPFQVAVYVAGVSEISAHSTRQLK